MTFNIDETFTSGTGILKIEGSVTLQPYETRKIDLDIEEKYKNDLKIQELRGRIINATVFIEEKLDRILIKKLGEIYNLNKRFSEKIKIFQNFLYNKDFFEINNFQLINDLKTLAKERNKFAHGSVVHHLGEKIMLEYSKNPIKREEISEEYLKRFDELVKSLYTRLDDFIQAY